MTDRFVIGLYDDGLASSKPDFFRIGVTNESLKEAGMQPVASERLNRYVRNGVSKSETPLSTETGNGSTSVMIGPRTTKLRRVKFCLAP